MPQAPDFETLYKIESTLETAFDTLLTADSVTVHKAREDVVKTAPYTDVLAVMGRETGRMYLDNASVARAASWEFEMLFRVVTIRQDDSTDHDTYRAKVRNLLAKYVATINGSLTYHAIADLSHNNTQPEVQDDDDLDISNLQFTGVIDIANGSWPA